MSVFNYQLLINKKLTLVSFRGSKIKEIKHITAI